MAVVDNESQEVTMRLRALFCILVMMITLPMAGVAQESSEGFSQEDARDMAFSKLPENKQKAVIAMLKKLMDESISEAENSIRENGSMVPFGYVSNAAGQGQFLRLSEDKKVRAEVAAHAVQKAIVTNAFRGNLVASALYLTMNAPKGLGAEIEKKLESSIKGDRNIDDVRFLMVELQHLGGLGLVMTVPYWQADGEWFFGDPVQKRVDPELHLKVKKTFRKAAKSGNAEG